MALSNIRIGKIGSLEGGHSWIPRSLILKYLYFLTVNIYTAWVADSAIFQGGWVSNRPHLSACIYIFQLPVICVLYI
jgi:hypothetical protein